MYYAISHLLVTRTGKQVFIATIATQKIHKEEVSNIKSNGLHSSMSGGGMG
jgi:hypothetical protein